MFSVRCATCNIVSIISIWVCGLIIFSQLYWFKITFIRMLLYLLIFWCNDLKGRERASPHWSIQTYTGPIASLQPSLPCFIFSQDIFKLLTYNMIFLIYYLFLIAFLCLLKWRHQEARYLVYIIYWCISTP